MSLKHLLPQRFSRPNTVYLGNTGIQLKHPPILTCIYLERVPIQNKRVPKRVPTLLRHLPFSTTIYLERKSLS